VKTGCDATADVTVSLIYGSREVVIVDLLLERDPNLLELCRPHADALSPPIGWRVTDHRADQASSA
jgi:hypothetical protein